MPALTITEEALGATFPAALSDYAARNINNEAARPAGRRGTTKFLSHQGVCCSWIDPASCD